MGFRVYRGLALVLRTRVWGSGLRVCARGLGFRVGLRAFIGVWGFRV